MDGLPPRPNNAVPPRTAVICGELLSNHQSLNHSFWTAVGLAPVWCFEDQAILSVCHRLQASVLIIKQSSVETMLGSADFVRLTNFGSGTHVLVILDDDNPEASAKMLRLGCRGVLPERPSAKVLRQAVLALIQGELWAPRRLISALYSELLRMAFDKGQNALTPQEQRILELSAEGHKNSAIAITLSISPETVRWHKRRLYRKIGRGGLPRFPQAVDVIRPITAAG